MGWANNTCKNVHAVQQNWQCNSWQVRHDREDQAQAVTCDRVLSPIEGSLGPDAKVGLGRLASSGPARPVLVCFVLACRHTELTLHVSHISQPACIEL